MDKSLIEKYKAEMLKMHKSAKAIPVQAPVSEQNATVNNNNQSEMNETTGNLIALVTTLRTLYPVPNAQVTVFTGDYDNMQVVATGVTDQSGRSERFELLAPARSLSMTAGADAKPYASYNLLIKAEGYLDNIHLNIPVFSGVTSLQRSNMLLLETAGVNKGPQIFDEAQQFQL